MSYNFKDADQREAAMAEKWAECCEENTLLRQQFDAANTLINKYREETTSLRQQLADSQEQVTLLRDVLSDFDKAAINSKSIIGFAGQSFKLITKMRKALAATQDLSGLILCEAEPVAHWNGSHCDAHYRQYQGNGCMIPLYKGRKQP